MVYYNPAPHNWAVYSPIYPKRPPCFFHCSIVKMYNRNCSQQKTSGNLQQSQEKKVFKLKTSGGYVIFIWNSGHETSITLLRILPKLAVTKETNTLKICCLKGRGLLFSSFQREKLTHCVPCIPSERICFKGETKLIFRRLNESSSDRNSQANDHHPSMVVTVGILNSNSTLSREVCFIWWYEVVGGFSTHVTKNMLVKVV